MLLALPLHLHNVQVLFIAAKSQSFPFVSLARVLPYSVILSGINKFIKYGPPVLVKVETVHSNALLRGLGKCSNWIF